MGRFHGAVGYATSEETAPGVWEDVITEYKYYGDVVRNIRKLQDGTDLNSDISVNNSISIVADEYARGNFYAIRYVEWAGVLWKVNTITEQSPRLILELGGVYNGATPRTTSSS